jgi:hypothetical protein
MLSIHQFCYHDDMIRTQLQLSEEQARALRELAAREDRSMADLVREALDLLLSRRRRAFAPRAELVARALAVAGRYRSGASDLARRHDQAFADSLTPWPPSSTPRR